jgi:hypothetical protein
LSTDARLRNVSVDEALCDIKVVLQVLTRTRRSDRRYGASSLAQPD